MTEDTSYVIDSNFYRIGQVNDIPLSMSAKGLSRKVLRSELIDNPKNKNQSVHACIVHQKRKAATDPWQDVEGATLANTTAKVPSKFPLDSAETWALYQHLTDLYEIGADGIKRGRVVVQLHNEDEIIRTDPSRARIIRKLLDANHGDEVWSLLVELQPDLADKLARALRHQQRSAAVNQFEGMIGSKIPENEWRAFLKKHRWMFGGSNVSIIDESRLDIKNATDMPFKVDGGFMDIVELKRPDLRFWTHTSKGTPYLYREKYLIPHFELQGAIAQTAGYILQAEKHVSDTDFFATHDGVRPLKPRGLVVHGRSHDWTEREWDAFRLLNDSLHGLQVMTFDHLLTQAKRAVEV